MAYSVNSRAPVSSGSWRPGFPAEPSLADKAEQIDDHLIIAKEHRRKREEDDSRHRDLHELGGTCHRRAEEIAADDIHAGQSDKPEKDQAGDQHRRVCELAGNAVQPRRQRMFLESLF
jgi:hypothetical protein